MTHPKIFDENLSVTCHFASVRQAVGYAPPFFVHLLIKVPREAPLGFFRAVKNHKPVRWSRPLSPVFTGLLVNGHLASGFL